MFILHLASTRCGMRKLYMGICRYEIHTVLIVSGKSISHLVAMTLLCLSALTFIIAHRHQAPVYPSLGKHFRKGSSLRNDSLLRLWPWELLFKRKWSNLARKREFLQNIPSTVEWNVLRLSDALPRMYFPFTGSLHIVKVTLFLRCFLTRVPWQTLIDCCYRGRCNAENPSSTRHWWIQRLRPPITLC